MRSFSPISPEHDDEAADEGGKIASADVSVEIGHAREKDGRVPQLELELGEPTVEEVDDDRRPCSKQEAVRDRREHGNLEQPLGSQEHVLDTERDGGG